MQMTGLLLLWAPELYGPCRVAHAWQLSASVTLPSGLLQDQFAKHIDFEPIAAQIMAPKERKMTPKMFAYQLTQRCLQSPQHIVLPEVRWLLQFASRGPNTCCWSDCITGLPVQVLMLQSASLPGFRCPLPVKATSDRI